ASVSSLLPRSLRHVETEMADLTVADQVVLAFEPELSTFPHGRHGAAGGDELVIADDFGTDESARDVTMDGTSCVVGTRTARNGPRSPLVFSHCEERDEAQQLVAVSQDAFDRGLGESEISQERRLLLPR